MIYNTLAELIKAQQLDIYNIHTVFRFTSTSSDELPLNPSGYRLLRITKDFTISKAPYIIVDIEFQS